MSSLSILLIAVGILAGSVVLSLAMVYFFRARASETATPAPSLDAGVEAIGKKIDHAMAEQRLQGETQRQMLAQKLDGVRESIQDQRVQVEGLRSEFDHERKRRDAELQEIRAQIGSIQQGTGLPAAPPPAALPPAPMDAPEPEGPSTFEFAAPASFEAPTEDPADDAPAAPPEPPAFGADPLDGSFEDIPLTGAFAPPPPQPPAAPDPADAPVPAAAPEPSSDDLFSDVGFGSDPFSGDSFSAPSVLGVGAEDPFAAAPLRSESPSEPAASFDSIFETAFFEDSAAPEPTPEPEAAPEAPAFEMPAFEEDAPSEPSPEAAAPPPAPMPPALETSWVSRPSTDEPAPTAGPASAPVDDFFGFDGPQPASADPTPDPADPAPDPADPAPDPLGLVDLDALAAPVPAPEPEPAPAAAPEGADDLTVISTIDEDVQRLLYQAGVLTLEEIAQWGRGDARRISSKVDVSDETIMNQWVFEAQAALFRQYAQQAAG